MSAKEEVRKSSGIRKYFEKILGRNLEVDADGEAVLRERVAAYTRRVEGFATSRDIGTTGPSTKGCGQTRLLDVSGVERTGATGKVEFLLSDFHCEKNIAIQHPANFLATPRSRTPVFLTAIRTVTKDARDLKITVCSWGPAGKPAGNTPFDWRCRVPYAEVVD